MDWWRRWGERNDERASRRTTTVRRNEAGRATMTLNYARNRQKVPFLWPPWLGRAVFCAGWALWWASMFIKGHWGSFLSGGPTTPVTPSDWVADIILLAGALLANPGAFSDRTSVVLATWPLLYCVSMLSAWMSLLQHRSCRSRGLIYFCRFVSVGTLVSWYGVYDTYTKSKPPPGCGDVIWAIGSTLIGLTPWLVSTPRRTGRLIRFAE